MMRNFGYEFDNLKKQIEDLNKKANDLANAYAEAEDFTLRFLKRCSKHKIKLVSIGTRTRQIDSARDFPFDCSGSVFADGKSKDGWPVIWSVVEEMGISGGAGNSGQHQVCSGAKLIEGVYEFKDKKWHKIE
jgi:hypothetical protein